MAVSVATVTPNAYPRGADITLRTQIWRGTMSFSAGTYPAGGWTVNWATLGNSGHNVQSIPAGGSVSTIIPIDVDLHSAAYVQTVSPSGAAAFGPSGFIYIWDNVNGNVHLFQAANNTSTVSGPLVEFPVNAPLPGNVLSDVVAFTAIYAKNA